MKRYFEQRGLNALIPSEYIQGRNEFRALDLNQQQMEILIGKETLNEERIHTKQMKELLFLPFYLLYLLFFLVYLLKTLSFNRAYQSIPFEREAKENRKDSSYCENRNKFGWLNYL